MIMAYYKAKKSPARSKKPHKNHNKSPYPDHNSNLVYS
jgi:hypothetical protein